MASFLCSHASSRRHAHHATSLREFASHSTDTLEWFSFKFAKLRAPTWKQRSDAKPAFSSIAVCLSVCLSVCPVLPSPKDFSSEKTLIPIGALSSFFPRSFSRAAHRCSRRVGLHLADGWRPLKLMQGRQKRVDLGSAPCAISRNQEGETLCCCRSLLRIRRRQWVSCR